MEIQQTNRTKVRSRKLRTRRPQRCAGCSDHILLQQGLPACDAADGQGRQVQALVTAGQHPLGQAAPYGRALLQPVAREAVGKQLAESADEARA